VLFQKKGIHFLRGLMVQHSLEVRSCWVHAQCALNQSLIKWREAYWCNFLVLVISSAPPLEIFSADTLGAEHKV